MKSIEDATYSNHGGAYQHEGKVYKVHDGRCPECVFTNRPESELCKAAGVFSCNIPASKHWEKSEDVKAIITMARAKKVKNGLGNSKEEI